MTLSPIRPVLEGRSQHSLLSTINLLYICTTCQTPNMSGSYLSRALTYGLPLLLGTYDVRLMQPTWSYSRCLRSRQPLFTSCLPPACCRVRSPYGKTCRLFGQVRVSSMYLYTAIIYSFSNAMAFPRVTCCRQYPLIFGPWREVCTTLLHTKAQIARMTDLVGFPDRDSMQKCQSSRSFPVQLRT